MRYKVLLSVLALSVYLTACTSAPAVIEVATPVNAAETEAVVVDRVIDAAFGKPCMYVEGTQEYEELKCAKGEVREEWKTPADGWQTQEIGKKKYINQVYDGDILLLPLDYGSNVYTIIGIDGELPEECADCPE